MPWQPELTQLRILFTWVSNITFCSSCFDFMFLIVSYSNYKGFSTIEMLFYKACNFYSMREFVKKLPCFYLGFRSKGKKDPRLGFQEHNRSGYCWCFSQWIGQRIELRLTYCDGGLSLQGFGMTDWVIEIGLIYLSWEILDLWIHNMTQYKLKNALPLVLHVLQFPWSIIQKLKDAFG